MIRIFKIVLLWVYIATIVLPSSAMVQQSATRQTQKPVRGVPEKSAQTKSDGVKPAGKPSTPSTTATGQPGKIKRNVGPLSGRTTTVTTSGPSIHIIFPGDGAITQRSVTVTGFVDNLVGSLDSVTVNGINATITNQSFSAKVTGLFSGTQYLTVNATDTMGNSSTVTSQISVKPTSSIWSQTGPEGVNPTSMAIDPVNPQTIYVSAPGLGIVKSTNGGDNWYPMARRWVCQLAIDPVNPNIVYCGAAKSTNGGATFTQPSITNRTAFTQTPMAINPYDSNDLLFRTDDGLIRSRDGGRTWALVGGLPQLIDSVLFDPANQGTIYAGGRGIYKSIDNGATWTENSAGLPVDIVFNTGPIRVTLFVADSGHQGVIYAQNQSADVFKTVDNGATWTKVVFSAITGLVFDPNQPGLFYWSNGAGIFRTTDNGQTFSRVINGLIPTTSIISNISPDLGFYPRFKSLNMDPTSPQTLYVTTEDGIYKSTDSGANWHSIHKGLYGLNITTVATAQTNPNEILAGTDTGSIYKSADYGQTWIRIDPRQIMHAPITVLTIDPTNPDIIYSNNFSSMLKSSDGGQTWFWNYSFWSYDTAVAIDPTNTQILYGGNESGDITKSIDGGLNWNLAFHVPGDRTDFFKMDNPPINCLAVDPKTPSTVYAGTYNGIYQSRDSGKTWSPVFTPRTNIDFGVPDSLSLAIDPLHPSTVYSGLFLGVVTSRDRGTAWDFVNASEFYSGNSGSVAIDPNATNIVYSAFVGAHVSNDRGVTWSALPSDPTLSPITLVTVTNDNPSTVFGGSMGNGLFRLIPSTPKPRIATGDVNRDGKIDVSDLMQLANGLAGNNIPDNPAADVNHDGKIDVSDLFLLANFLAGNNTLN